MIPTNHQLLDSPSDLSVNQSNIGNSTSEIAVTLLTGGIDRPYAFGLSMALASNGIKLDVIGGSELDSSEIHGISEPNFFKLYRDQRQTIGLIRKLLNVAVFYIRLIRYAATAKPRIFHILWNYKFPLFDRTLLMLYYKLLGKKIVFTA